MNLNEILVPSYPEIKAISLDRGIVPNYAGIFNLKQWGESRYSLTIFCNYFYAALFFIFSAKKHTFHVKRFMIGLTIKAALVIRHVCEVTASLYLEFCSSLHDSLCF